MLQFILRWHRTPTFSSSTQHTRSSTFIFYQCDADLSTSFPPSSVCLTVRPTSKFIIWHIPHELAVPMNHAYTQPKWVCAFAQWFSIIESLLWLNKSSVCVCVRIFRRFGCLLQMPFNRLTQFCFCYRLQCSAVPVVVVLTSSTCIAWIARVRIVSQFVW